MPRKVNYRIDYAEDYDYHDDYDYDHDLESNGEAPKEDQSVSKPGYWRCAICTYDNDNDDNLTSCDICGAVRIAPVGNSFEVKAAPFKFDRASPDDMVSAGKKSYGKDIKAKVPQFPPSKTSPVIAEKGKMKAVSNAKKYEASSSTSNKVGRLNSNDRSPISGSGVVEEDKIQATTSDFLNLKLKPSIYNQKNDVNGRKTASFDEYKPEPWMLPDQKEQTLPLLNLAIVGHVDSGKSTLSGRLLHLLGRISPKEMHKYEKESKQMGKGSFAYAWALDESSEERERGITMTVAIAHFETKKYHVVVLDSPGHKDFVPNMISGATQADAAILVVDAALGSFEAGMDGYGGGGQTKEHAQLVRSFGVDQIIVAVNKMDAVHYSEERFNFIRVRLGSFLRTCGFKESSIVWIPLSAMENQNLITTASELRLLTWYKGSNLLEAIDSFLPPVRETSKPLRMPICDVMKSLLSLGQIAVSGKLEAGAIRNGSKVLVMPYGHIATVKCIVRDSRACSIARAGDNVDVGLQGIDASIVMAKGVLCHPEYPVAVAASLELKVLILDITMPILVGSQVEFHVHHAKEAARVVKILSLIDPKTGKVSKKAPRCLTARQSAMIEVNLERAVCIEEFSKYRALGRVYLRANGKTIAVGVVTRIIHQ
ncbi:HBS1-like protein isoform X2 [Amborella trichopoda]|uniref:HBS1-like protein isoform X2 n=1 Tax=Amborella trichopoda TaxID=13333 RepID=UPI0005D3D2CC|nr:HBS1-like protein isoform X2 [Amborella trichopoda]|eukprot:XP_020520171.1 HBS1-like protein isoform X2 [Amborella trichopoda]